MASDFVGRGAELALLEAVCARADREARPAAALITGHPGAGKTRLLAELRNGQQAGTQLSIAGYQTGRPVPLAAAGGLLRALAKVPGAGARLAAVAFGTTPADDHPLEPLRIFEAVHRSLIELKGTILLFIDDLQWVDELSIALCSYLIRSAEAEGKGLVLIAASRPAGTGAAFYHSMTRGLEPDRATTIVLGPLGPDDSVRLVKQLAPRLSPQRAAEVWTRAQGSPFWLGVLARAGGQVDLADYLVGQERALGRDASRLLRLLAVAARPLSPAELGAVLDWGDTRTEQAVTDLERSGLVVLDGVSVRTAHDLIASSVEAQLPAAQLRQLHAVLGGWFERQAGGDVQLLMEALVHGRKAGLDVSDLALRVLQSPRRRLLGREGLNDLAHIADSAGFSGPVVAAIHDQVALLASELGNHQFAMQRWMELAANVSDPALAARCYLGASRSASRIVERRGEALPLLARARSQKTPDEAVEVEIEAQQANLLRLLEHRMNDAQRVAEQAVLRARQLWSNQDPIALSPRDRDAYVAALQAAFDAAVIEDNAAHMLHISREITQIARGSEVATLSAALNTSVALWFLGRTEESVDCARRAWVQSHERVLPMLILAAGSTLASKLIELGDLAEAEEIISECVELERRIGGASTRLAMGKVAMRSVHDLRHLIWFSRGEWRDAVTSLEREVALQPDPHYRLSLHGNMVVWLARCGGGTRSVDIDRHLVAAGADAVAAGCRRCAREMALRAAEAHARLGRIDDAAKQLQTWDADGRPAEFADQLWRRHVGALVGLATHDRASVAELEAIAAERTRLGLRAALLWTRLDLAAVLAATDGGRAATELRQAGIDASAIGAATEQQLAELALRRLGVHTWRRGPGSNVAAGLDRLTDRERQIARLIASGHSNPEIADTLFLSRKTIERHVSNVLARTGARNRTDLARLISSWTAQPSPEPPPKMRELPDERRKSTP